MTFDPPKRGRSWSLGIRLNTMSSHSLLFVPNIIMASLFSPRVAGAASDRIISNVSGAKTRIAYHMYCALICSINENAVITVNENDPIEPPGVMVSSIKKIFHENWNACNGNSYAMIYCCIISSTIHNNYSHLRQAC